MNQKSQKRRAAQQVSRRLYRQSAVHSAHVGRAWYAQPHYMGFAIGGRRWGKYRVSLRLTAGES